MRIVLALLVMLGGCDPDYEDTAFRCDAVRGCPTGQSCESGRCRRGGAVGEVACGVGGTCTSSQQCCVDGSNPPRCIAAGDECPGGNGALCDSFVDCQTGDACCYGLLTYCHASCGSEGYTVCTVDADCPSANPHCCPDPDVPWGYCQFDRCS